MPPVYDPSTGQLNRTPVSTDKVGVTAADHSGTFPTTLAAINTAEGDVAGPASSVDGNLASFDGTTGKLLEDSLVPKANVVQLAAAQTLSGKKLSLTAAHTVDDTYEGLQIPGLANLGGVTQWDAVYLNGSSQWVKADANGSGTYPARGLAVATALTTVVVIVLIRGTVRNDAWAWIPGGTIYLDVSAGALTQTPPATTGDKVQAVGFALTADIAFFDFCPTYIEVA